MADQPTKVADVSALSGYHPATHNHLNNQDGLRPPLFGTAMSGGKDVRENL